jgi:hypothetical protein
MNNMISHLKKNVDVCLLNYLLIIIYFIVFTNLNINVSLEQFSRTPDSWTYFSTSNEFYKFSETGYSNIRPFLYPLIILIVFKVSGVIGLWLLQFLFWTISINLIYLSIKRITNNKILGFTGSLILALNMTYLVLTFHALTETTTIFLLSCLIYFVSLNAMKINTLKFFHGCLLILVLLALVKPLFYLLVLLMLCIILPIFYLKIYIKKPKRLLLLTLIIIPLLVQVTLMKVKYDTFSFSPIGSIGFNYYLFAQGVERVEGISLDAARVKIKDMPLSDELSFVLQNKMLYADLYFQNMKANIKAVPCFLLFPGGFPSVGIAKYMLIVNSIYYYIHIIFIIPILVSFYSVYRRKDMNYYLILMVFSWFLICYMFLTLPIIFGEGDRYVLIAQPLWVFLYALVLNYLFKKRTAKSSNSLVV